VARIILEFPRKQTYRYRAKAHPRGWS